MSADIFSITKTLVFFIFLAASPRIYCQDTTYYTKEGYEVSTLDSCYTFMVLTKAPDNLKSTYIYFKSGQPKSEMHTTHGLFDGSLKTWWDNGLLKRHDEYKNNKLVSGHCYDENGIEAEHTDFEIMPQFPGGEKALLKYIQEKFKSKSFKTLGKIVVEFIIKSDGSVANVTVVKSIDSETDSYAVQVVKDMPKWTPGIQDGKPVQVSYRLPIYIE